MLAAAERRDRRERAAVRARGRPAGVRRDARAPDRPARHGAARRGDAADEGLGRAGAARVGRRPRPVRRRSRACSPTVRAAGWAATVGERKPGVASVSAPVRVGEHVVAAIGVSGPAERLGPDPGSRFAAPVLAAAADLGARSRRTRHRAVIASETIASYVAGMNVELVRWPERSATSGRSPRPGRAPAAPRQRRRRAADPDRLPRGLGRGRRVGDRRSTPAAARSQARARAHGARPEIDGDGLLRHHDAWVSLSPVEQALTRALLDRFGAVVAARRAREPGLARRRADPQRARRARAAAAPAARAARARDPHRAVARLPASRSRRQAQRADGDDGHAELALRALIPHLARRARRRAAPGRAVTRSRARRTSSWRSSIEPTR